MFNFFNFFFFLGNHNLQMFLVRKLLLKKEKDFLFPASEKCTICILHQEK